MPAKRKLQIALLAAGVLLVACYQTWKWVDAYETRLFALDAATGKVAWSLPRPTEWDCPEACLGRVFLYQPGKSTGTWRFTAHDASTGRLLWANAFGRYQPGARVLRAGAVGEGGFIVSPVDEDSLGIFRLASGALQWRLPHAVVPYFGKAAFLSAGRLVAVTPEGQDRWAVRVLDVRSGAPLWQREFSDDHVDIFQTLPCAVDGRSVFVRRDKGVEAFDLQSGALRFSIGRYAHQLLVEGTTLYGYTDRTISAFDAATGALRWTRTPSFPTGSDRDYPFGLQTGAGVLYVSNISRNRETGESWLLALDADDGAERWQKQLDDGADDFGLLWNQPDSSPDTFFVFCKDARDIEIAALSAQDGSERWRFPLWTGTGPIFESGLVFLVDRAPRWRNWLARIKTDWHRESEGGSVMPASAGQ